jgi:NADH dehydrogenase FAD-containing subunit
VTFVQGNVRQITDSKITVETPNEVAEGASSKEFNFDKLVIAAGAQPRVDTIKGAADFSLPFSRVEDAVRTYLHNFRYLRILIYIYM